MLIAPPQIHVKFALEVGLQERVMSRQGTRISSMSACIQPFACMSSPVLRITLGALFFSSAVLQQMKDVM
jgi:hypothetical protein